MSKLKISNRFAVTPNDLLNDERISYKAKGLYGLMQSKPDGWEFSLQRLCSEVDKIDSVRKGINELINFGWLTRERSHDDKGHAKYDYELQAFPILENPNFDNPTFENPTFDNPTTYKERVLQKKNIIKKEIKKEDCMFSENPANIPHEDSLGVFKQKLKLTSEQFEAIKAQIIACTGRKIRVINDKAKRAINARIKEGYLFEDIISAIKTASETDYHKNTKFRYLTMEFFGRADILDKYSDSTEKSEKEAEYEIVRGNKGQIISINGILKANWTSKEWNINKYINQK